MSEHERHTRTLRIRVEADDKYLDEEMYSTDGWQTLADAIASAMADIEADANNFGDVRITVEGWEDETR